MSGWHRYLVVTGVALFLAGCAGRHAPAPVDEAKQEQQKPATQPQQPQTPPPVTAPGTVPEVPTVPAQPGPIEHHDSTQQSGGTQAEAPKVRHYSWSSAMDPLVSKMVKADGVNNGGVLLVENITNRTNGSIQTSQATEALRNALAGSKFTLVGGQQLAQAKRKLGLSPNDSLGTRSKALGIARTVGAEYVLYSTAAGSAAAPTVKMQLLTVKTGEIVWSGSGAVQQTH
ncbi:penicillin-binding protein activator LpoB [Salmonella enterica subsp. enterica serovar Choleraesuis]|nr:penicillin-binding protein activator LpoB [Salmonella enterica subsp. enterica serovar Choleraesuis]